MHTTRRRHAQTEMSGASGFSGFSIERSINLPSPFRKAKVRFATEAAGAPAAAPSQAACTAT
eukprot:3855113-Prymnesium_polylepis.1